MEHVTSYPVGYGPLVSTDPIVSMLFECNDDVEASLATDVDRHRLLQNFLRALCKRLDCDFVYIVGCIDSPSTVTVASNNAMSAADRDWFCRTLCDEWNSHPLLKELKQRGDCAMLCDVPRAMACDKDSYTRNFLRPLSISQETMIRFDGPSGKPAALVAMRRTPCYDNFRFCEDFMSDLLPSLEASLAISAKLRQRELIQLTHQEALNNMSIGIFVLDGRQQLIDSGSDTAKLRDYADILRLRGGQPYLTNSVQDLGFQRSVAECLAWHAGCAGTRPVAAFRVEYGDSLSAELLVQPAPHVCARGELDPHVLVCMSHPSKKRLAQDRLVAQLFGLGMREAQLAVLLADGYGLRQAAEHMGVTHATVKTYLQRVFNKTCLNRQSELVELILKSVVVLA